MEVFDLQENVIENYADYIRSFLTIKDERMNRFVEEELGRGFLWPNPLVQLNPAFETGRSIQTLVDNGILHSECVEIFSDKPHPDTNNGPLRFHQHQEEGILAAHRGHNYVLTTGTGSGKSLSYIVPIVDHVLREGSGKGVKAIIIYPMNALANSQLGELRKFLEHGYPQGRPPVTFQRYTGQESEDERQEIIANPPDILLTNYVMLELILTRPRERKIVEAANNLRFLVLDELHTYRGRQGADVAMLVRRVREMAKAQDIIHVGTSATLSSGGNLHQQQAKVANVATKLLGEEIKPENIIGESLRRVTAKRDLDEPSFIDELRERIEDPDRPDTQQVEDFLNDPLSVWIESTFGLRDEPDTGRLIRCKPIALSGENGAASQLANITGTPIERCEEALEKTLLKGYHFRDLHNHPIFAFRLHQFISKGESVYASTEPESDRHITLQAQQFVPGSDRSKILLSVAFCRECGQEYYVVRKAGGQGSPATYNPRELTDRLDNDDGEAGFLYITAENPWPSEGQEIIERLPDSWIEIQDGVPRIRATRRDRLPREVFVSPAGVEDSGALRAHYIKAPFSFCMTCGVDYSAYQRSDFGKLATLGSEGRSTATTVLSLTTIRKLRQDGDLSPQAQKLLSFTDNRQDASLQAGHFNDFVEIGLLRSALWRAVDQEGKEGLRHDNLTRKVFDALDLPLELYAVNPEVEYLQLEETQKALRRVLGYYLYRDLRRGWRVTSPNLEQCGLLDMDYLSLHEFCTDDRRWESCHPILVTAKGEEREAVCRVLLDYMRRELAIRVDYLDAVEQESIQQLSNQYLISPWALDELEPMERSTIVLPRSTRSDDGHEGRFVHLSPRGGFGLYLKRTNTFPNFIERLKTEDIQQIIVDLIEALCVPGLVQKVLEPRDDQDVAGYQLNASGLVWRKGDGSKALHDPVRIPNEPEGGHRTNPFFVDFYRSSTEDLKHVEAREHTAQVTPELREEREDRFREAWLPLLFCSPTMELGVDISQLNVVNMRNVPPTPANYAQRSGRAGRSGQPAFAFTYCSGGSPHDQYFFKRPEQMVAGVVSAPRLDLANEDLLKAHVHAIWLSVVGLDLRSSLSDILDLSGEDPTLELQQRVQTALNHQNARSRAKIHAKAALGNAIEALVAPDGDVDEWLGRVLDQVPYSFNEACERWRGLYLSASNQAKRQSKIIDDASRDKRDRDRARRLRAEAEAQRELLLESGNLIQSDFYSYRYFASEGFLPGYNFPRLPLSAYLPGRRRSGHDEFLSRPRFLAISEFGPRAIIYHEGSRYVINKVILPIDGDGTELTRRAVQCEACGYIHPLGDDPAPDLCEHCGVGLPLPHENLFRMQNVATRRRDRINSDEEERFRLGYDIRTGVRFAERGGAFSKQLAVLKDSADQDNVRIIYGHSATLWRLNMGWRRRKNQDQLGYVLDTERGFWARNQAVADDDPEDPMSASTERVIPYVEDRRNCILLEPVQPLSLEQMASLQSGLKAAIQVYFQLEDNELAAEPLPDTENRRQIVLYESAEGGAGVLHHLVEDGHVLPEIAELALRLSHFDPSDGTDLKRAPYAREDCDAACYDCLLSYYNQQDHRLLDRKLLLPILSSWMAGSVTTSPRSVPRKELVARLKRLADSELEKKWIDMVDGMNLRLPSDSQVLVSECKVSLDFMYRDDGVAIFIDGSPHDTAEQQARDRQQQECLEDVGYHVIRFHHEDEWETIFRKYPSIFGNPTTLEQRSSDKEAK